MTQERLQPSVKINRRQFLALAAVATGGLVLGGPEDPGKPDWQEWTSGLQIGLQRQVVDSFLEKHNFALLNEALKKFSQTEYYGGVSYGGFDKNRNYWAAEARFLIIGTAKISTKGYPGGKEEDFIQLMYGVNPDFGPASIFPFVVGIRRGEVWQQATPRIFDARRNGRDRVSLDTPEEMEGWLNNEVEGQAADISMYLYFAKSGDWNGIHQSYESTGDIPQGVKNVMDSLSGNYIQRFTASPELVKGTVRRGPGNLPEILAKPPEVLQELSPDIDPGLFVGYFAFGG